MRIFRSFIQGIKNCITWFPIIWNDAQFDQYYLLLILSKKLKLMSEFKNHWSCNFPKEQKRMKIASLLAKRLADDDYITAAPIEYEMNIKDDNTLDIKVIRLSNCIGIYTKNDYEEIQQRQDLDMLCDILKKRMFYWWD